MLFRPESLEEFASQSLAPPSPWTIREMAAVTRVKLGEERIAWRRGLKRVLVQGSMALFHDSPDSSWQAPAHEATDAELECVYGPLGKPVVVCGHIHYPYIRADPSSQVGERLIANTGSVGLSYDGGSVKSLVGRTRSASRGHWR